MYDVVQYLHGTRRAFYFYEVSWGIWIACTTKYDRQLIYNSVFYLSLELAPIQGEAECMVGLDGADQERRFARQPASSPTVSPNA